MTISNIIGLLLTPYRKTVNDGGDVIIIDLAKYIKEKKNKWFIKKLIGLTVWLLHQMV